MLVAWSILLGAVGARAAASDESLRDAPSWVSDGCEVAADAADEPDGLCAVGRASEGAQVAERTAAAEENGRAQLARKLDTPVQSMLAGFTAANAAGGDVLVAADVGAPTDVPQHLATTAVGGATRSDLWISPSGTVYALMVLDVTHFQRAVWSDPELPQALRAHLAREAPAALDEDPVPQENPRVKTDEPRELGALMLVTETELSALPADVPVRNVTPGHPAGGPVIRIDNPENQGIYTGPFPIRVEFLAGPKGFPVDMESLKLEYKRAWGIDITDRVRDYVAGTSIDVAESELPRGKHTVEIQISDTDGNRSQQHFTVTVK
jgi:hypothetical protein